MTRVQDTLDALGRRGVAWSICVTELDAPRKTLFSYHPDAPLPTASAAKVLLLLEAARAVAVGEAQLGESLQRSAAAPVADSGLWQHLAVAALPLQDVARLVGTVSDNLATNVLLARVGGVDRVAATAQDLGIRGLALHDIVRDIRSPEHPATLSTGTGRGCADLFARLATGDGIDPAVAAQVREWLHDGTDLSMVAGAFGLDPLAHHDLDRGFGIIHKTGTDAGTRADAGIAHGPARTLAYGCIASWDEDAADPALRDEVLAAMRRFGMLLRGLVSGPVRGRASARLAGTVQRPLG